MSTNLFTCDPVCDDVIITHWTDGSAVQTLPVTTAGLFSKIDVPGQTCCRQFQRDAFIWVNLGLTGCVSCRNSSSCHSDQGRHHLSRTRTKPEERLQGGGPEGEGTVLHLCLYTDSTHQLLLRSCFYVNILLFLKVFLVSGFRSEIIIFQ